MQEFVLEKEFRVPRPREEVFRFFADAANLQTITPPWLNFRIVSETPIALEVGTLIDYRLRVRGLPLRWRSKITAWDPPARFVDEQIRGPYKLWVHEHTFKEVGQETLCRDVVRYGVPGGRLVQSLLVGPDLERIFDYREKKMKELFTADHSSSGATDASS